MPASTLPIRRISLIPGHLVFGRRRFMRSLAPADGTVGVPIVYCPPFLDASGTVLGLIINQIVTEVSNPNLKEPAQAVTVETSVV